MIVEIQMEAANSLTSLIIKLKKYEPYKTYGVSSTILYHIRPTANVFNTTTGKDLETLYFGILNAWGINPS